MWKKSIEKASKKIKYLINLELILLCRLPTHDINDIVNLLVTWISKLFVLIMAYDILKFTLA